MPTIFNFFTPVFTIESLLAQTTAYAGILCVIKIFLKNFILLKNIIFKIHETTLLPSRVVN
ncbi:MAG TPA: hypothetical protein PKK64_01975, partial [Saprospiraceae bacterium]|nr:hypothetical protein [Saprospiraceae bacterium]